MNGYFYAFEKLLDKYFPKVHKHLDKIKASPNTYLVEWLFTVYCRAFDLKTTLHLWDLLVQQGS